MKLKVFRIGLCDCSSHWHEKLNGLIFTARGKKYWIRTVVLSRKLFRRELVVKRCHAHLDHHRVGKRHEVTLQRIFVKRLRKGTWRGVGQLHFQVTAPKIYLPHGEKVWRGNWPPSPLTIVNGVSFILEGLEPVVHKKWLSSIEA